MTGKQKIVVMCGGMFLVMAFVFIYWQFSSQNKMMEIVPTPLPSTPISTNNAGNGIETEVMPTKQVVPETPDTIVDDVLRNDADTALLEEEELGESQTIKDSTQMIDDISNAYDEE